MRPVVLAFGLISSSALFAQWTPASSPTSSDLRSISAPSSTVAWASGKGSTVLRTIDAGTTWTACAPISQAKAASLDSIQAFDADTAVVLTSGRGGQSRLFRTADACKSWQLVFTNPDATGEFRSLHRITAHQIYLLGSPVEGKFALFLSQDSGLTWFIADDPGLDATPGATIPEASNAALTSIGPFLYFITGGTAPPGLYSLTSKCTGDAAAPTCATAWNRSTISPAAGSPQGQPVLAGTTSTSQSGKTSIRLVALYSLPASTPQTQVALSADAGASWLPIGTPLPGSFRALSYNSISRLFVAVGDSGSMRSSDYGKTWQPIPASGDPAASGWTDIAQPFAVGSAGRIGLLSTH